MRNGQVFGDPGHGPPGPAIPGDPHALHGQDLLVQVQVVIARKNVNRVLPAGMHGAAGPGPASFDRPGSAQNLKVINVNYSSRAGILIVADHLSRNR